MKKKNTSPLVRFFDTTLRDGTQGSGVSLSVEDKLKVATALDHLGMHYIEGGWPGSNPKDETFFAQARKLKFKNSRLVAFGSTRRKNMPAHQDPNLRAIVRVKTPVGCIFGKTWELHVIHALRTTLDENLKMIRDSVAFLKNQHLEVVYDAEHFFDGFRDNSAYALQTLKAALEGGADCLTLCDTNGGSIPSQITQIVARVRSEFPDAALGIHTHNDSDCAVANTIAAVEAGARLVQGTINGYGERCGNANLISILPNLQFKLGMEVLSADGMKSLTEVSRYVAEIANVVPKDHQPYVGVSAFAHKGGVHVSAMARHSQTYEHINPALVGNQRRILISELSGQSNVLFKAEEMHLDFAKDSSSVKKVIEAVKKLEHQGYQFEGAEGSFAILVNKTLGEHRPFFDLLGFRTGVEKTQEGKVVCEATLKLSVRGVVQHTVAEGDGPVSALDNALRKALEAFYPSLKRMSLTDFKVRVINAEAGTQAKVRVLIESRDEKDEWSTIGVSENIIEASWIALVDAVEYKLFKDAKKQRHKQKSPLQK